MRELERKKKRGSMKCCVKDKKENVPVRDTCVRAVGSGLLPMGVSTSPILSPPGIYPSLTPNYNRRFNEQAPHYSTVMTT